MLTLDEIRIYYKYGGDPDWYSWAAKGEEAHKDKNWGKIYEMIFNLSLIKAGLTSPEFASNAKNELLKQVENEEARDLLRKMIR